MSSEGPCESVAAAIDARRERGDHRFDPVRFRFIEALARRAAAHGGEARRILDDRVAKLLAAYDEDLERAPRADGAAKQEAPPHRGALAELVDHIARHASSHRDSELKTLAYFRSTWSRLSAERRLTQSLATVPQNAGPLNSRHLVHRSLMLMRELSPEYLNHFMSYVDALLWVDGVNGVNALAASDSPRAENHRKRSSTRY